MDSGAIYSVVPATILRKLGIKPLRGKEEFRLANGSKIERRKGIALFRYEAKEGGADVIFGSRVTAHCSARTRSRRSVSHSIRFGANSSRSQ